MRVFFNIIRYSLYAAIVYFVWYMGLLILPLSKVDLYENGIFQHSITRDNITFQSNGKLVFDTTEKGIQKWLKNIKFINRIDKYVSNDGVSKINIHTSQPHYYLYTSNSYKVFNNVWSEVVINKKDMQYLKNNSAILKIEVVNNEVLNYRYLRNHVISTIRILEKFCTFDEIVRVRFLKNIQRINITFAKIPKVAMLVNNIEKSCKLTSKFYSKFHNKLYQVQYLDLRLPKNAVFRIID